MSWEGEQLRREIAESFRVTVKSLLWGMIKTIERERHDLGRRTVEKRDYWS